jgi:hypothetical protein
VIGVRRPRTDLHGRFSKPITNHQSPITKHVFGRNIMRDNYIIGIIGAGNMGEALIKGHAMA